MRGTSAIKRIGGSVLVAAALAGATAGPAGAATAPACSARVIAADVGTQGTCNFDTQYDYATIAVVVDGTVTVTLRCNSQFGYTYTTSRTLSKSTTYSAYTPGGCQLVVTSASAGTTANVSATPTTGPIIDPGPML